MLIHPLVPYRQNGLALLIFLFMTMAAMLALIVGAHAPPRLDDDATNQALADAQEALLAWSMARPDTQRAPPGLMPYTDRANDGDYDGQSDCVVTDLDNNLLRIGMLPWRGEPESAGNSNCEGRTDNTARTDDVGTPPFDASGSRLWLAVSRNVIDNRVFADYADIVAGHRFLTPAALRSTAADPHWLRVCGADGQILADRAALVIIAPGAPLGEQRRGGAAPAARQFLDAITLPAPCGPVVDHAGATNTYVLAPRSAGFNDRIRYLSRDAYLDRLVLRTMQSLRAIVAAHAAAHGGALPDPADPADAMLRCDPAWPAAVFGMLPAGNGEGCAGLLQAGPSPWPAWDDPADPQGWFRAMRYRRIDAGQAELSIEGCASLFTLQLRDGSLRLGRDKVC
ncbi:hypothetical protein [Chitinimonas koreensis]|uniref:hypothetical protein n=1 Tax=Chitinimonas koreensis TaxID=356302 RepID=UPI0003F63956|nr:hypothetical protein [Chitinimonas koreensis]QNM97155.1 hypothetical protein H9L41_02150 [Chitinimonas koreensis]